MRFLIIQNVVVYQNYRTRGYRYPLPSLFAMQESNPIQTTSPRSIHPNERLSLPTPLRPPPSLHTNPTPFSIRLRHPIHFANTTVRPLYMQRQIIRPAKHLPASLLLTPRPLRRPTMLRRRPQMPPQIAPSVLEVAREFRGTGRAVRDSVVCVGTSSAIGVGDGSAGGCRREVMRAVGRAVRGGEGGGRREGRGGGRCRGEGEILWVFGIWGDGEGKAGR